MKLSRRTLHMLLAFVPVAFSYIHAAACRHDGLGLHVLGIFLGVLTLTWLTEAIDWPSLLLLAALAFIPELSFSGHSRRIHRRHHVFIFVVYLCARMRWRRRRLCAG